jgi:hypothetical protein
MTRNTAGKLLLSFVLIAGAAVSVLVDMNHTHLFNHHWHPHAVFHDALMLLFLCGVSLLALWVLWRRSAEPAVGLRVAALVPVLFWTPFYYITWLLPHSSLNATDEALPVVAGVTVYPNVVVATLLLVLTAVGYLLARDSRSLTSSPATP